MSEAVVLALVAAVPAFLGVALTAVLHYGRQSVRDVVDAQKEMIGLLTTQRDDSRAEIKAVLVEHGRQMADKDRQIRDLERKIEHHEGRPTRGGA